jgi:Domain of unknown function (DUF4386)
VLVYRSRFLPQFLGVWLALGGFAYLALSLAGVLWPQYQGKVFTISQPAFFGEIALMLWLVIKGAKPQPYRPRLERESVPDIGIFGSELWGSSERARGGGFLEFHDFEEAPLRSSSVKTSGGTVAILPGKVYRTV